MVASSRTAALMEGRIFLHDRRHSRSRFNRRTQSVVVGPFGQLLLNWFVPFYASVADEDDSMGVKCDVVFVGDEYDGVALLVQPLEQSHDFVAGGRIEVSGRFV